VNYLTHQNLDDTLTWKRALTMQVSCTKNGTIVINGLINNFTRYNDVATLLRHRLKVLLRVQQKSEKNVDCC